jgi:hypothetical protein
MRNTISALLILGLLNACASRPPQEPQLSAPNPATQCAVLPITQYVWTEGYSKMLSASDQQSWFYPVYAGLGTLSWMTVTPFLPVMDILVIPLRITQPCS